MSVPVLTNCQLLIAGYDVSGRSNKLAPRFGAVPQDVSAFGVGAQIYAPGLTQFVFAAEGFADPAAGLADEALFGLIGLSGQLVTMLPAATELSTGWFGLMTAGTYRPALKHGEPPRFSVDGQADSLPIAGTALADRAATTSGNTSGVQVGAASATQKLYAGLHVTAVSGSGGPSLTCLVQSSVDNTFASPTTQVTFGAQLATGGTWATPVAGPVTDTWWRVNYTISGGTPSFTFALLFGIQ